MDEKKSSAEHLIGHVEEYINTKVELTKLLLVEKSSNALAGIVFFMIVLLLFFMMLVFFSITVALLISSYSGNQYTGFLIVGLCYLIATIVLYFKREKWIFGPLNDNFVKRFLQNDD